ncbi:NAD(P)-linked oxidoreductase superfamily protein isoform 1 [Hibiscus syriacus]|uniref:NAD(P)-linked oxidoreductase superfamily protein isoform 1 n=1 Tax=Hibiscus syriacus TaxID=106335 RepID=A0A6A3AUD9_HIBSY|nr:NAD(P)-linked oxidoreductase superfamily protein isoform 1 [Hibiscus syriacus]
MASKFLQLYVYDYNISNSDVSLDLVKSLYAKFIDWDSEMIDYETGIPSHATNTAISEDLGQVEYIMTDKTGTLTENRMIFRRCCINGIFYGNESGDALKDDKLLNAVAGSSLDVIQFVTVMAICNTVIPIKSKTGAILYKAQSQDEDALVNAAAQLHMVYANKNANILEIRFNGSIIKYELLEILEFTSDRKRMSVVVKDCQNGKILLLSKGADESILPYAYDGQQTRTFIEVVEQYAQLGLRTLCLAWRELKEDEYQEWSLMFKEASSTLVDREWRITEVCQRLEYEFEVLGVTAIEDCLQDGVPETIETLRKAGINFWMLTGDKQNTTIQIALSCNFISPATLFAAALFAAFVIAPHVFFAALKNAAIGIFLLRNLSLLELQNNNFDGKLSPDIANLSKLVRLDVSSNNFSGEIPDVFSQLHDFQFLVAYSNQFTGGIPSSLSNCPTISLLNLRNNSMDGPIVLNCSAMVALNSLDLATNKFTGPVPDNLPLCRQLENVNLAKNKFGDQVPESFREFHSLSSLSPSNSSIRNLSSALRILNQNHLVGTIPSSIGSFTDLFYVNLSNNLFTGQIPKSLTELPSLIYRNISLEDPSPDFVFFMKRNETARGLQYNQIWSFPPTLDFGLNFLSGPIWPEFGNLKKLYINGKIPSGGQFPTFPSSSFDRNNLCGEHWSHCQDVTTGEDPDESPRRSSRNNRGTIVGMVVGIFFGTVLLLGLLLVIVLRVNYRNEVDPEREVDPDSNDKDPEETGSRLVMDRKFHAEVEALSRAQHPNLVHLQGYCIPKTDRLLIYSFMENSNFDFWLHEKVDGNEAANRIRCSQGSSLLASVMLILPYDTHVTTDLVGTLGYIPPEYGQASAATYRGDVYSFGVVLLEFLTGKRPMDMCKPKGCRDLISWVIHVKMEHKESEQLVSRLDNVDVGM